MQGELRMAIIPDGYPEVDMETEGWLREEASKLDLGEGTSLQVVENRDLLKSKEGLNMDYRQPY